MTLDLDCRFAYGRRFALDLAMSARASVTALVGPSGSGKTTTLRLIAGLLRPAAGRIALDDEVLVDIDHGVWRPPQRRGVALVFQDDLLFPHLSVRQNLAYGWERRGGTTQEWDEVVGALELEPLLPHAPRTLSGGEARRVALGRGLLAGPRLILLDEPFSGLDQERRLRLETALLGILNRRGLAALLVSHDAASVARLAGEVVRIDQGRVRPAT